MEINQVRSSGVHGSGKTHVHHRISSHEFIRNRNLLTFFVCRYTLFFRYIEIPSRKGR